MSVSNTATRTPYTGNGSTTSFATVFQFQGAGTTSELTVVKRIIATGVESTLTYTTDYTVTAYLYNYNVGVPAGNDEVVRGTRKCVISALGLAAIPDFDDLIVGSGDTVKITSVMSIFSAGTAIGYICNVGE